MLVVLEVEGDVDQMATLFGEYITDPEGTFLSDYGKKAWGGYDGPFVLSASMHQFPTSLETPNDR